ncbi:hypothetical protein LXA43DRAFT_1093297 [Ganoderma leucocontextum]|nr:hypothetical protein LXA43DRAFT_1093297 [Ganoderma leucocontextum]
MFPPLLFGLVSVAAVSIRLDLSARMDVQQQGTKSLLGRRVPLDSTATVNIPLDDPGQFYDEPLFEPDERSCNTVMYSVVEACQLCQFNSGGGPQAWVT